MKALYSIIAVIAIATAACSGSNGKSKKDPDDGPKYQDTNGLYCQVAVEIDNTCNCDGPREFDVPIPVMFTQSGTPAVLTSSVEFAGGGLTFTGTLTSSGSYSANVEAYDENVASVSYEGLFTDEDDDNASDYHGSTDPVHITMVYYEGACCEAAAGSNTITLSGDKVEECPPEEDAAMNGPLWEFRSDRRSDVRPAKSESRPEPR